MPTVIFRLRTGVAMMVAAVSAQTLLPGLLLLTKPFGPGGLYDLGRVRSGIGVRPKSLL